MKKTVFTFSLLLFIFTDILSQNYTPIDTSNLAQRQSESKIYLDKHKKYIDNFKAVYKEKDKSFIIKKFDEYTKEFNENLLKGYYVFDKRFSYITDSLTSLILKSNSYLDQGIRTYISRDISLNASSLGDNSYVINMGSFYFLDNENQLAAILSHEIGHYYLKHQLKSLQSSYKNDKIDARVEVSEIKSNKYNKGQKALNSFRSIMYSNSELSRIQENEADSLGYVIYKNSGFNPADYLSSYLLMAEYDSIIPIGLKEDIYHEVFNLPQQPFNKDWLKHEDFTGYTYIKFKDKLNEDSLKTHPDVKLRIKRLRTIFPELNDSTSKSEAGKIFNEAEYTAYMEQVPSLVFNEEYGYAIYACLLRLQKNIDNSYFKNWIGTLFQKIYDARKAYTLNRYVDRIDPTEQSESYQQFLNFIWNLNLTELKNIADYYKSPDLQAQ